MHFGACDVFICLYYAIDVVLIVMCCFGKVIIKIFDWLDFFVFGKCQYVLVS